MPTPWTGQSLFGLQLCPMTLHSAQPLSIHTSQSHNTHSQPTVSAGMRTRCTIHTREPRRSDVGGAGGGRDVYRTPSMPTPGSTALWDSPAETSRGLEKHKAFLHPCWAHAPCPWGRGPETATPGPKALRCFQVGAMEEGMVVWGFVLCPRPQQNLIPRFKAPLPLPR